MNNINENSEESYDSSCDTIKDEFEPTKLNTNIKEIKQEQKLNEEVDKQIFKIIGKSLEDFITPQGNEEENDKNDSKSKSNIDNSDNKETSNISKKKALSQLKNKVKTMKDNPKKKKGKFSSRKSAVFQSPITSISLKKK